ncbi:transporter substrate-binding domain-containing protein [Shewanella sp. VB17]|uniref:substrate-binding periplasmic protein n=1 Tax=Shewanella sp. VB17 TaxID=2739432 RepID=UPI0015667F10|nr:transporter substrate-binding domain-containing protein [Shewanella sp. VB17]NRD72893.1 transporter substrate-binding domain-containing protein [Shewanella sp. VB17]
MYGKWNSVILVLFFTSSMLYGEDNIVSVTTLGDYAPFSFIEGNSIVETIVRPGENIPGYQGYSWDILRESFHIMGYTIKLSVSPWPRAMQNVKTGKIDILFPTGMNEERLKVFDYSHEFVNEAKFLIYVRAESPIKWIGLESLNNLVIGVKRGFNYGDKWHSVDYVTKYDVNTISQGFQMLEKGRIDGFIGYENTWDYILKQQGWSNKYNKMPSFGSTKEYIAVLKTNPNGQTILQDFDIGKQKLIESGKLKEIEKFWFGKDESIDKE